jgi:hypothetical protein
MTLRVRFALAAAAVVAQTSLIACGLDFDRFDPTDASSESSAAQMNTPGSLSDASRPDATQMPPPASDPDATQMPPPNGGSDATQMSPDASGPDVTQMPRDDAAAMDVSVDVAMAMDVAQPPMDVAADRSDAGTPVPRDASCTPPANCFRQAQSCGTQCSDQHKQCLSNCVGGNCMRRCDTSEQNCLSQCGNQCELCALLSGCSARSDCFDAAGGG